MPTLTDPVRDALREDGREPDLDHMRGLYEPTAGEPAYDPAVIQGNVERLASVLSVDTGHAFLDRSIVVGLAHVDATFQGDHPKYGVKEYGRNCHDGFPPTIIAAVDALSAWGLHGRATQLFRYWVTTLVRDDGTIHYRGTSLAELGQLLDTATVLHERAGADGWWDDSSAGLDAIAENLLALRREAEGGEDNLIAGVPEDDEKDKVRKYFHNNAWVATGLARYADLRERTDRPGATSVETTRSAAGGLASSTVAAVRTSWPDDPGDWWLPPQVEPLQRPGTLTATRDGSYTNYRYWPELLSSGVLPDDLAHRVVDARLSGGGQFCGMTRFDTWLDDWPLYDYLVALWRLGRMSDFFLSLYGHVAYHQAADHLTAYEQVTHPPGKEVAPYCLPCQLLAARAGRLLAGRK